MSKASRRGAVDTSGIMGKFTRDSGPTASNTVREYGEGQRGTPTLGSGGRGGLMATEFTPGSMAIVTRVSSKTASSTDRGSSILQTGTHIKVTTSKESLRDMGSITGHRVAFSRGISKRD